MSEVVPDAMVVIARALPVFRIQGSGMIVPGFRCGKYVCSQVPDAMLYIIIYNNIHIYIYR